jgi:anti-sigma factor RsiW
MNRPDEHAKIREKLAQLVAGALDAKDEELVSSHLARCDECAAELRNWQAISAGLRRLPTPQPPAWLFERTRSLVVARLDAQAEQRRDRMVLTLLIFFSWALTLVGWPLFRLATGGLLSLFDVRFHQMWLLFVVFSALAWIGGGSAAVLLSLRRHLERRLA